MGRASPEDDDAASDPAGRRQRDVVVPLDLYKVVITFSTLLAILGVVAGFITLDAATRRASAPASSVDPVLALLGLAFIAGGALIYVFASRFRTAGMGTDKTGADQPENDG